MAGSLMLGMCSELPRESVYQLPGSSIQMHGGIGGTERGQG